MPERTPKTIPFQMVLTALLDETKLFPPAYLHQFSDISRKDLDALKKIWLQASPTRRVNMMEDLEELAESDTLVSFDDLSQFALTDPEPSVRATAIRLLWEDQDLKLAPIFTNMMLNDPDSQVRSAAASALGLFVYLGELEEINAEVLHEVEDSLLDVLSGRDDPIVRRRALEALGYSGRPEVPELIQTAFDTNDAEWQSSALFAMGRSADPRWESAVLQMMSHPDVRVQMEAVRAAGNLELVSARLPLLDLVEHNEELDEDVHAAAIWALSQIGGEGVREILDRLLEETDDDDTIEYIEQALENLSFTEDFELLDMFDFDAGDEEENMKEINLLDETNPEDDDNLTPKNISKN